MIWVATLGLSTYVGFVTEMQSRWRLDLAVEIASRLLLRAHNKQQTLEHAVLIRLG